jgi:hypothetical protein
MNDSLYLLDISLRNKNSHWTLISTTRKPSAGLYNYGIVSTLKGRLVLYGGITNTGNISRLYQNLTLHSNFWYLKLDIPLPDFTLANLNDGYGGISRIVLLQGETICILSDSLRNQMLIIDMEEMVSYKIIETNSFSTMSNRTAFGVVSMNRTMVAIIGGLQYENSLVNTLRSDHALLVIDIISEKFLQKGAVPADLKIVKLFIVSS